MEQVHKHSETLILIEDDQGYNWNINSIFASTESIKIAEGLR